MTNEQKYITDEWLVEMGGNHCKAESFDLPNERLNFTGDWFKFEKISFAKALLFGTKVYVPLIMETGLLATSIKLLRQSDIEPFIRKPLIQSR